MRVQIQPFSGPSFFLGSVVLIAFACLGTSRTHAGEADEQFYKEKIEPMLKKHCFECHSHAAGESNGELMLDSSTAINVGGTRGKALVAGKPDESLIIKAIEYKDTEFQMPPAGKLPDEVIADFRKWVADGAHGLPEGSSVEKKQASRLTPETAETHWAYRRPVKSEVPDLASKIQSLKPEQRTGWTKHHFAVTDPIDVMIRSKLLDAGIEPSPTASRRELARRVYYDLVGLPATAEQLHAFESDSRPLEVAYADLVDRLLASPHFGERWARYWMDVARYADTKGYVFQEKREYPEAYKYRDWLITALNSGISYDEFIKEQLAADTIDPENVSGKLPALGFLTLGRRFLNNKQDIIDDRLDVTSRGLMGLTLACARCHDHKYDPVSQADYYALYGVFLNTEEPGGEPWAHRMTESKENRKSFILIRGSPGNRGAEVPRRFVSFLSPKEQTFENGSGRVELAQKIVSSDNPLTARVFVNRVWMRLLGASIVDSPSDFGARCPAPRQQDVLDTLAVDFEESGWEIKSLIRRLMLTATYQQASVARREAATVDMENGLYWRMNRRRMDFESLRDASLAVSGQLDTALLGASERIEGSSYTKRRTVYAFIDRQNLPGVFRNFDVASPDSHSPQRLPTTVPQQGLYLLNSVFETTLSKELVKHAVSAQGESTEDRVRKLFQTVLSREPDADELAHSVEFLSQTPAVTAPVKERWICGYGCLNPETGKVDNFQRIPFYSGTAWQGGTKVPDDKLGWIILNNDGGHPGNDLNHVVIRRFIAPKSGTVSIRGRLNHPSDQGDGVRATITSSGGEKLGQWTAKKQETRTELNQVAVKEGDVIDLIVDPLENNSHDSYQWKVRIRYSDGGEFDSSKELPAPALEPLSAWDQLAQALMASNEFAFVD